MFARAPRWIWWTVGTFVIGVTWGIALQLPLQRQAAQIVPREQDVERRIQTLNARMAAVPSVIARLDSARGDLTTRLGSYAGVDEIETLMAEIIRLGHTDGLDDIRVTPDLERLLQISSPEHSLAGEFHLDTIPLTMAAQGRFASLGHWMEQIEERPDFRLWLRSQWTAMDEGLASIEMSGAFIVVNRPGYSEADSIDPAETP